MYNFRINLGMCKRPRSIKVLFYLYKVPVCIKHHVCSQFYCIPYLFIPDPIVVMGIKIWVQSFYSYLKNHPIRTMYIYIGYSDGSNYFLVQVRNLYLNSFMTFWPGWLTGFEQNIIYIPFIYILINIICIGPSSSWSYGSWIYNYLWNQCLSPLKLWDWTLFMARCTRYNIMWSSLSVACDRSVVFSRYSGSSTNKTDHHDITEINHKPLNV